jgi:hypothetical protein
MNSGSEAIEPDVNRKERQGFAKGRKGLQFGPVDYLIAKTKAI